MTAPDWREPDLPLLAWGDALRRTANTRRHRTRWLLATMMAVAALLLGARARPPMLVWNLTASAPVGLYLVRANRAAHRGDLVLLRPSDGLADLVVRRGYAGRGVPLLKAVAATRGATICATQRTILVDGHIVARRRERDYAGRPLPDWYGCRRLGAADVFLLNPAPGSFDGRYFGATRRRDLIGIAAPLWLIPTMLQDLAPASLRARCFALYSFVIAAFCALGPLMSGGLSDRVFEGDLLMAIAAAAVPSLCLAIGCAILSCRPQEATARDAMIARAPR